MMKDENRATPADIQRLKELMTKTRGEPGSTASRVRNREITHKEGFVELCKSFPAVRLPEVHGLRRRQPRGLHRLGNRSLVAMKPAPLPIRQRGPSYTKSGRARGKLPTPHGGSKGVPCPLCGFSGSMVVDSRPSSLAVYRRRKCMQCDHRFTTYEQAIGYLDYQI